MSLPNICRTLQKMQSLTSYGRSMEKTTRVGGGEGFLTVKSDVLFSVTLQFCLSITFSLHAALQATG